MYGFRIILWFFFFTLLHGQELLTTSSEDSYKNHSQIVKRESNNKWSEYLEEENHYLYGTETPIFMVKRQKNHGSSFVSYERREIIISSAQAIERMHFKRELKKSFYLTSSPNNGTEKKDQSVILLIVNKKHHEKTDLQFKKKDQTLYVKILIVVDYDLWTFHGRDLGLITTYITSLLNGVDLRFRQMSNPQIRLNLAGIIIPEEPDAVNYLEFYDVFKNYKIGDSILHDLKNYFSTSFSKNLVNYDVIFGLVRKPIAYQHEKDELESQHSILKSFGRVARTIDWRKALPMGVISDDGSLGVILKITRALGFLLGAPNDGYENTTVSKNFSCSKSDGYIMGAGSKNGLKWSTCSIKGMQTYLRESHAFEKMKKKPLIGMPLPKKLPGELYNRNHQCKTIAEDTFSVKEKETNCLKLECKRCFLWHYIFSFDIFCSSITDNNIIIPAEGSSCGLGRICLNGQCVRDGRAT